MSGGPIALGAAAVLGASGFLFMMQQAGRITQQMDDMKRLQRSAIPEAVVHKYMCEFERAQDAKRRRTEKETARAAAAAAAAAQVAADTFAAETQRRQPSGHGDSYGAEREYGADGGDDGGYDDEYAHDDGGGYDDEYAHGGSSGDVDDYGQSAQHGADWDNGASDTNGGEYGGSSGDAGRGRYGDGHDDDENGTTSAPGVVRATPGTEQNPTAALAPRRQAPARVTRPVGAESGSGGGDNGGGGGGTKRFANGGGRGGGDQSSPVRAAAAIPTKPRNLGSRPRS